MPPGQAQSPQSIAPRAFMAGNPMRLAVVIAAVTLLILARGAMLATYDAMLHYQTFAQDLPLTFMLLVGLAVLCALPARARAGMDGPQIDARTILLIGGSVFALATIGSIAVMHGYDFSRDEQLAVVDATIVAGGVTEGTISVAWLAYRDALNTLFVVAGDGAGSWKSVYLPVNAALRAAAMQIGAAPLIGPAATVVGLYATWRVACRLWPDDREAHAVAVVLFALSAQTLALAMTSYAMAPLLAFNMLWLWAFLVGGWRGHGAAMTIGVVACGTHQLVYHPLFAGPFLATLLWRRQWRWAAAYALVYAAALFAWSRYAAFPVEGAVDGTRIGTLAYLMLRIEWATGGLSPDFLAIQAANLLRYFAWQHLLLLPLMLVGGRAAMRSRDPVLVAMAAAIIGLILFKLIMRPYQGHGWGFRYLHGLSGIACLLGALGWQKLRARSAIDARHFAVASGLTLAIMIPAALIMAEVQIGRFAAVDARIAASAADVAIVDDGGAPFAVDLVANPPAVDRRPVRLKASALDAKAIARLCGAKSIVLVEGAALAEIARSFRAESIAVSPAMRRVQMAMATSNCSPQPLATVNDR